MGVHNKPQRNTVEFDAVKPNILNYMQNPELWRQSPTGMTGPSTNNLGATASVFEIGDNRTTFTEIISSSTTKDKTPRREKSVYEKICNCLTARVSSSARGSSKDDSTRSLDEDFKQNLVISLSTAQLLSKSALTLMAPLFAV